MILILRHKISTFIQSHNNGDTIHIIFVPLHLFVIQLFLNFSTGLDSFEIYSIYVMLWKWILFFSKMSEHIFLIFFRMSITTSTHINVYIDEKGIVG